MNRRDFIKRVTLVLVFGGIGAVSLIEAVAKFDQGSPTSQQTLIQTTGGATQSQQAPSGYIYVAPLSALSGKTSAYFNHPSGGPSILVEVGGQWRAFSSVCTHAGCSVQYTGSSIYCPCHAGYFSPTDGSVQGGPPPSPLAEYGVSVSGGDLYVSQARIN